MIQRTIQVGKTRVDVDKIVAYEPYYSNDEHITLLLLDNGTNFYEMGINFETSEERDDSIIELDKCFKK